MRTLYCLAVAGWIALAPRLAAAEADKSSFAFAQAPEQGSFTCLAGTAEKAAVCAMKKCTDGKHDACAVMTACSPGWAGVMGVMLEEVHFSEALCGAPSKAAAIAALTAFCRGHLPHVRECVIAEVWSPEGRSEKVDKSIDPRKVDH